MTLKYLSFVREQFGRHCPRCSRFKGEERHVVIGKVFTKLCIFRRNGAAVNWHSHS